MSSDAARVCENCRTELAGPFCHRCGQRADSRSGSLWQFVRGSLDFESRTMRTLARLLTSPGTLTREFLDGRRVPYMQPLAHIIFSLHWCAFYLLLMVLERLVSRGTAPNAAGTILAVIALVYLTLALRRVHRQSWLLTILKSCALFLVFNAILALWVVSVMLAAYRFNV